MPKTGALIINLATGEATRVDNVKSFQVPEKGGPWAAFHKHPATPEPPASGFATAARPPAASDLLLRHLPSARERILPRNRRLPASPATPCCGSPSPPKTRT
jgi:hypothetical protein